MNDGVKKGIECEVLDKLGGDEMPWNGGGIVRPSADPGERKVRLQAKVVSAHILNCISVL